MASGRQRWLRYGALAVGLLAAAALAAFPLKGLFSGGKAKKPSVQTIAVLRPPPPPPPKPEEKPPEPEMKKEEVKLPDPEPKPQEAQNDQPPPGPDLGVDADGSGAGDGFGLVGKKGGQDITTIGQGGGGAGRVQYAFFTNMVQAHLQEELSRNKKLRSTDYKVVLKVWFGTDGRVERTELAGSSGDGDIDQQIRTTLAEAGPLRQPPPPDMPQPVKLRLTSRGAG